MSSVTGILAEVTLEEEDAMPERRQGGLWQAIAQTDEKHDAAHKRLREDIRELQAQHENLIASLSNLRDKQMENGNRIDNIAKTPPNIENLIMSPKVLVSIVVFTITVIGSIWSSTSGLRSDVRDILTRMEAQKTAYDATSKLQEVQSNALKTAIDDMKRRQELQQYEIQGLKEAIITGKPRPSVR